MARWLCLVILVWASPSMGQDNLGDGRALERDLTNYPAGRPPARRNIADDIRFRNALVTGNVPGGSSFRGDVGYTSPFEFRGDLATDDLFAFRRDSLFSGLGGIGIRGTEAVQYQFAMTTGSTPPRALAGDLRVSRDGPAAGSWTPSGPQPDTIARAPDPGDSMLGDMRSTSTYLANAWLQPELIMSQKLPTGDTIGIEASALRGVQIIRFEDKPKSPLATPSLNAADNADATTSPDLTAPSLATPFHDVFERLNVAAEDAAPPEEPGAAGSTLNALEQRIRELQNQLQGRPAETPAQPEAGEEDQPERSIRLDRETMRVIRESGGDVETLIAGAPAGDLYAQHMARGQELLAEERFFDAEARFVAALGLHPSDPAAAVGRMHAQLGAGMLESASINLRQLLIEHPQLAGVKYGASLLPPLHRLEELKSLIRERAGKLSRLEAQAGLLLAYIGFQTDDEQALSDGLDLVVKIDRETIAADGRPDPVAALVLEIWSK